MESNRHSFVEVAPFEGLVLDLLIFTELFAGPKHSTPCKHTPPKAVYWSLSQESGFGRALWAPLQGGVTCSAKLRLLGCTPGWGGVSGAPGGVPDLRTPGLFGRGRKRKQAIGVDRRSSSSNIQPKETQTACFSACL